jgi:hypothetical protein
MKKILMTAMLAGVMTAEAAHVMTWVPPYRPHIDNSWNNLNEDFGGVGMKDGLTHLALQFWLPTASGGVVKDDKYEAEDISDAEIAKYVQWGDANNVKTLLCVYNNDGSWNWNLAKSAFATNKQTFIDNLIYEMERLNLDGIELDLEGPGVQSRPDEASLLVFVRDLSIELRAKGKELTIATFASKWHVPGTQIWTDLAPFVDAITSMGYEEIGRNAPGTLSYSGQKGLISTEKSDLMMGMPGHVNSWLGNTVSEQLDWVISDGVVGVAIWDAGLSGSSWKTAAIWNKLKTIKGTVVVPSSSVVSSSVTPSSSSVPISSVQVSSSSLADSHCTTWTESSCVWETDGYVCPSDQMTSDGKNAFSCVSGSNSVWCSSFGPNENDWNQWKANGKCDQVSAVSLGATNIEMAGRNTILESGQWQLVGLSGAVIQNGKARDLPNSLGDQESGIYFLRVFEQGNSQLFRLILK